MNEMRSKVTNILRSDYGSESTNSYKKEITNTIVNDIKDKIKDFKKRKDSEKMQNRENELNIEVNMDLLNKFKKTKTISSPAELSEFRTKSSNTKKESAENENTNSFSNVLSPSPSNNSQHKKFQDFKTEINFSPGDKREDKKSNHPSNPITLNNSRCHTPLLEENSQTQINSKILNNVNTRPLKSFLTSNEHFDKDKRNKSEDKKVIIENKRTNLLETLSEGTSKYQGRVVSIKSDKYVNLNVSNHSNRSNEEKKSNSRIKDKIKNFVFEIEGVSSKNKAKSPIGSTLSSGAVTSSYQNKLLTKKNEYDISNPSKSYLSNNFNTINSSNYTNQKEETKKTSIFDEIKYPKFMNKKQKSTDFDIKNNQWDDGFFKNKSESTSASTSSVLKLKADDIKKLTSQIRFCSPEDLRKMDENLIDELINLSGAINKTFELKIKAREFKLK